MERKQPQAEHSVCRVRVVEGFQSGEVLDSLKEFTNVVGLVRGVCGHIGKSPGNLSLYGLILRAAQAIEQDDTFKEVLVKCLYGKNTVDNITDTGCGLHEQLTGGALYPQHLLNQRYHPNWTLALHPGLYHCIEARCSFGIIKALILCLVKGGQNNCAVQIVICGPVLVCNGLSASFQWRQKGRENIEL